MMAFLGGPPSIPLNTPGRQVRSVCKYRPPISRPARVVFSALIDKKKTLGELNNDSLTDATSRKADGEQNLKPRSFNQGARDARPPRVSSTNRSRNFNARPRFEADPEATYYTKCAKCFAAYEMDPSVLGSGRRVACSVCGNEWFQKPERLYTLRETEEFTDYPMDRKDEIMERNQRSRYSGKRRERQPPAKSLSVFIGNLPFSVSEDELKEIISNVVVPKRVAVVVDADGRSKGYAFADVHKAEDVDQLVNALDNTPLKGRSIAVRPGRRNS
ncbi:RNA recognition motif [Gracilaria domingensis]|nr:RNA recognition motif [Gracilaria domingensis]